MARRSHLELEMVVLDALQLEGKYIKRVTLTFEAGCAPTIAVLLDEGTTVDILDRLFASAEPPLAAAAAALDSRA